jgi:TRAP transporter 4TM/12TM fusion protein
MGAAAFLMAEFLDISYFTVAKAALIPAMLYYLSLFVQVDLIAGRDRISVSESDVQTVASVLLDGWHFAIPFGLLLAGLFWWRLDPEDSALLASVAIVAVGFVRGYRGTRLDLRALGKVFVDTGIGMVDLIMVVAAAGFVIGILNITGLGFALTLLLVDTIGSNIDLLLAISAVICIILGMGMPTSGVYVLLATLVAPSLVQAGIEPVAAHLFILYFGMMSMITPPVALASFAAATITRENPLVTGLASLRAGWAAFFIPFVFVSTPALLLAGGSADIVSATALSAIGICAVTAAIVGYWSSQLSVLARLAFAALGIAALPLGFLPISQFVHWIAALMATAGAIVLIFSNRIPLLTEHADSARRRRAQPLGGNEK